MSVQTKRTRPWRVFGLAYGWSWLSWVPAALFGLHSGTIGRSTRSASSLPSRRVPRSTGACCGLPPPQSRQSGAEDTDRQVSLL